MVRNSIVALVQRHYEPFDVNVVVSSAGSLDAVNQAMAANSGDVTGQFDAYVFVTGVTRTNIGTQVGRNSKLLGIAARRDLNEGQNTRDETAVVFADDFLSQLVDGVQVPYDIAMADVASHESGHTLGLVHSQDSLLQENYPMMLQSDIWSPAMRIWLT